MSMTWVERRMLAHSQDFLIVRRLVSPTVQHRDAVAGVAHRNREVHGIVGDLGGAATARGQHEVVVEEADFLRRVFRS